jgi:transposase InsO family protein
VGHGRRQILWFGVTAHPTAEWIANQITQACGWEQAPRYLIRDRDGAYGEVFIRRLRSIGIRDRPTPPRSPWQNGYAERLIGSIRRECLDHVVVFGERHLRHVLQFVHEILQRGAYASILGEGCASTARR